eukprot:scpid18372/ scgid9899/ 
MYAESAFPVSGFHVRRYGFIRPQYKGCKTDSGCNNNVVPYLKFTVADGALHGTVWSKCGCNGAIRHPHRNIVNVQLNMSVFCQGFWKDMLSIDMEAILHD